ncbi:MAG: SPFH domain-containing protein, partial [Clostridia bacterium]|nr:SPFH domain-containing protein [Clostridia bacterium]
PVPFRVVDKNIGLDIDIAIRCFGEYSYKFVDPLLFYANVCGNVENEYRRSEIDSQLKTELMTALQPAFAKISEMGIRYSALPGHTQEIADALNEVLSEKWTQLRGLKIVSFGVASVTASEEDEQMIKQLQRNAAFRDPTMAAAHMVGSQAQAMQDAAKNEGGAGAMGAFIGMGMAQNAGGMNSASLYSMGQQTPQQPTAAEGWTCACGRTGNTGKFCSDCGAAKPADGWKCSCGAVNKGRFCSECGKPKPVGEPLYKCDKCGWEPEDPKNPPKFCPECGDPFDDNDRK